MVTKLVSSRGVQIFFCLRARDENSFTRTPTRVSLLQVAHHAETLVRRFGRFFAYVLNLNRARKVYFNVDSAIIFSAIDFGVPCPCTAALRRTKFVPLAELFGPMRGTFSFFTFSLRSF